MSSLLYRLGSFAVRRRWVVLLLWLAAVVAVVVGSRAAGGQFHDEFSMPGTESGRAIEVLRERFPQQAGSSARIVFHIESGALDDAPNRESVALTLSALRAMPHVAAVGDPFAGRAGGVSSSRTTGFADVQFDASVTELKKEDAMRRLEEAVQAGQKGGMRVELGGELPLQAERPGPAGAEVVGVLAALVILLFTFGSVVATALPVGLALAGLLVGISLVGLLAAFTDVATASRTLGSMIGLGAGIDYALLIVTRHRQHLREGLGVAEAAGRALATAGLAVLFAGGSVAIAISGLAVAGLPFITVAGISATVIVAVMVLGSLTLLPALLGFAGHAIDRWRLPGAGLRAEPGERSVWARVGRQAAARPWLFLIAGASLLLVLASPVLDMRLGMPGASTKPEHSTVRRAYDLLAEGFGPGFSGPLLVAVELPPGADARHVTGDLRSRLAGVAGVAGVSLPLINPAGDAAVLQVAPATGPQDAATEELVRRLREAIPPALAGSGAAAHVGGQTATMLDISTRMTDQLIPFMVTVIGLSFLLLMLVFRSILVPLKAALLNLLSVGAAYGIVVAVFQWGWLKELFGIEQAVPVVAMLPLMLFAVVFGLSMDYEVFLLSRVREYYLRTGRNTESVVRGIASTAPVITSAAAIMVVVFLGFVYSSDILVKQIGLGLAAAILLDATIVRVALVPSTMVLLGNANWWIPRWLDRLQPKIDIEGERTERT